MLYLKSRIYVVGCLLSMSLFCHESFSTVQDMNPSEATSVKKPAVMETVTVDDAKKGLENARIAMQLITPEFRAKAKSVKGEEFLAYQKEKFSNGEKGLETLENYLRSLRIKNEALTDKLNTFDAQTQSFLNANNLNVQTSEDDNVFAQTQKLLTELREKNTEANRKIEYLEKAQLPHDTSVHGNEETGRTAAQHNEETPLLPRAQNKNFLMRFLSGIFNWTCGKR